MNLSLYLRIILNYKGGKEGKKKKNPNPFLNSLGSFFFPWKFHLIGFILVLLKSWFLTCITHKVAPVSGTATVSLHTFTVGEVGA